MPRLHARLTITRPTWMATYEEIVMKALSLKTVGLAFSLAVTSVYAADGGTPFEQTQLDRVLPNVQSAVATSPASGGASAVSSSAALANGAWATNPSFIAPAQ